VGILQKGRCCPARTIAAAIGFAKPVNGTVPSTDHAASSASATLIAAIVMKASASLGLKQSTCATIRKKKLAPFRAPVERF
jgi:hypothetical protein